jgi:hypothetical protein
MADNGRRSVAARQLHLVHALPPASEPPDPAVTAARLFRTLDGHTLRLGSARWQVNVYSIRGDGASRWAQIALVGPRRHTLTLKLSLDDDGRRALGLVADWLGRPFAESEQILTVS